MVLVAVYHALLVCWQKPETGHMVLIMAGAAAVL